MDFFVLDFFAEVHRYIRYIDYFSNVKAKIPHIGTIRIGYESITRIRLVRYRHRGTMSPAPALQEQDAKIEA